MSANEVQVVAFMAAVTESQQEERPWKYTSEKEEGFEFSGRSEAGKNE